MLPPHRRVRAGADFGLTVGRGRRAGRGCLTVHLHQAEGGAQPRAGFVVSKAVGGAVVRNRVRRRLRHLVSSRLDSQPPGSLLVVRAAPAAASASSLELAADLDAALRRIMSGPVR